MGTLPTSQQKVPTGYSQAQLQTTIHRLQVSLQMIQQKNLSLTAKINKLQNSSSTDSLQQLQTDTIIDMYQIVKEMNLFLNPLLALYPANPFE